MKTGNSGSFFNNFLRNSYEFSTFCLNLCFLKVSAFSIDITSTIVFKFDICKKTNNTHQDLPGCCWLKVCDEDDQTIRRLKKQRGLVLAENQCI